MATDILLCVRKPVEHHRELFEKLIKASFPEPKYHIIPFDVNPEMMVELVSQQRSKISSSNPPVVFLCDYHVYSRCDVAKNWQPLFQKCKAVAFFHFLGGATSEENAHFDHNLRERWEEMWPYVECENIPYKIVNVVPGQESLTPVQLTALQALCHFKVKKVETIVFCLPKYGSNTDFVRIRDQFIKKHFSGPQYRVISLIVDPDHVNELVQEHLGKMSNLPALFFCNRELGRVDVAATWRPLFEKCKAIALVHISADEALIQRFWTNGRTHAGLEKIPYQIVNINPAQEALTDEQLTALQEVCNTEVEKVAEKKNYIALTLLALGVLVLIGLMYRRQFRSLVHLR